MIDLPLLAIDPGKNLGWALAVGGELVDFGSISPVVWNGRDSKAIDMLPDACVCIIEMPRVYPAVAKWKGDPQHIVRLAFLAGRIAARYPVYFEVEPKTWQGGSPPERVLRRRTSDRMRATERSLVMSRKLNAHSWDAIGILLYSLNRRIQTAYV